MKRHDYTAKIVGGALCGAITATVLAGGATFPAEFRTIDGSGNNIVNNDWGAADGPMLRLIANTYDDGVSAPAGPTRPNVRDISNAICAQTADIPNSMNASNFIWQWGQFIDHDITLAPFTDPIEPFDIHIPAGDPWFDPMGTGLVTIPLERSGFQMIGGIREQMNVNTAYIDASMVYGSDEPRALELRTLDGTGRMKTSAGNLLPYNVNGFFNFPADDDPTFFLAGDVRASEQSGLTCMHTLFVREHNFWADRIADANPGFTGEMIYQYARAMVAGIIQKITYDEFLPILLGSNPIPAYSGYDDTVNASIGNEFSTAGYRVGHTLLPTHLLRLDGMGNPTASGPLDLADAFFVPSIVETEGIEPLLRGLAQLQAQEVDHMVIDDVRNFLFGPPGAGGFDLTALNLQRGRDHGLATYNQIRVGFGRPAAADFDDIHPDPAVWGTFASVYSDVDEVDPWIGLLAEPHRSGALVGETLYRVLADQFGRLRDGDRFWYETYLPASMQATIDNQTLSKVIRRNTTISAEIQASVFFVKVPCLGDFNHGGTNIDVDDLLTLFSNWGPCDFCDQDLDADGNVGVTDMLILLTNWGPCI